MKEKIFALKKKIAALPVRVRVIALVAAVAVLAGGVAAGVHFTLREKPAPRPTENTTAKPAPSADAHPDLPEGAQGSIECSMEPERNAPGLYPAETELSLEVGDSSKLSVQAYFDSESVSVVYVSGDEDIVTVNGEGELTGVSAGESHVQIITVDMSYTVTVSVTVIGGGEQSVSTQEAESASEEQSTDAARAATDAATEPYYDNGGDEDYQPETKIVTYTYYVPVEGGGEEEQPSAPSTQPSTDAPAQVPTQAPTQAPTASNASAQPTVTVCSQVGSGIYIVAGICSADTEYVRVSGDGVTETDIVPDIGDGSGYYIGQVNVAYATRLKVQGKESGKELSEAIYRQVSVGNMANLMTSGEYMPVFCNNSRMHFYSAILAYTLSDAVPQTMQQAARNNIASTVSVAKDAGAEVIYFIVPSSAAVYPETLPAQYTAASGETVFETFKRIAESEGATVIYPLDTMTAHKNDGAGYDIYLNTDSHWSAYGAYWGVYDLMNYISRSFPAAAPRSVSDMGFYTKALYGGDSLFSFPEGMGFESVRKNGPSGKTEVTGIKELATMFTLPSSPTSTLNTIYKYGKSVYIDQGNGDGARVSNPAGAGLPSAVILRDSFGCTAYDIINDRFSCVWWQPNGSYTLPVGTITENRPDYVIYLFSERNLTKIMLNNSNHSITNLE